MCTYSFPNSQGINNVNKRFAGHLADIPKKKNKKTPKKTA